jgi:autophagy-related protein 101
VLHAVLFHRLFGTVKPKTVDVLDVTLPGVDDPDTDRLVGEKVGAFWRAIEERLGDKKGQVSRVVLYGAAARG